MKEQEAHWKIGREKSILITSLGQAEDPDSRVQHDKPAFYLEL